MKKQFLVMLLVSFSVFAADLESWRNTRPSSGPVVPFSLPKIHREQLPNGLQIYVVERHELPIAQISLITLAGSSKEYEGRAGLANLTFSLLDEGAGEMDALALSEAFSDIGTQVSTMAEEDAGFVSVPVLSKFIDRAVQLVSTIVKSPTFKDEDFVRVQNVILASLQARGASPYAVASDAFVKYAYGAAHPYGHPVAGNIQSVSSMKNDDVKQFWKKWFGPRNSALIISGDVTVQKAHQLATSYFGDWHNKTPINEEVRMPPLLQKMQIKLIERTGSPQTMLMLGRPLVVSGSPELPKLTMMNAILGGMFTSRINMNLREDKGWTYGAYSQMITQRGPGPFLLMSSIQVPYAPDALKEIVQEFNKMRSEKVSLEELTRAKDRTMKSYAGRFSTVSALNNSASSLFVENLPLDYLETFYHQIEKVTIDDVNEVADKALQLNRMTAIAVGDLSAMQKQIEALNVGEVEVVKD